MCSVGGMLAVMMVQQPGKVLMRYKSPQKTILSYTLGQVHLEDEDAVVSRKTGDVAGMCRVELISNVIMMNPFRE